MTALAFSPVQLDQVVERLTQQGYDRRTLLAVCAALRCDGTPQCCCDLCSPLPDLETGPPCDGTPTCGCDACTELPELVDI